MRRPLSRRRSGPRSLTAALAFLVSIAILAAACTGDDTETEKETAEDRFLEGYGSKTFTLAPDREPASRPTAYPPSTTLPDEIPIDHVVFIIKENRTFDHFYGTYPGAEGVTEGSTIDGTVVPLKPATDTMDQPITHGFWSGLYAVDGGRMDGFDTIVGGENLDGYVQFDRSGIPNYWAYADRFVLTDRFFTSDYGPTFPEHLYTVAADSYGIMDNKAQLEKSPGKYCDDELGYAPAFPQSLTDDDKEEIVRDENIIVDDHPNAIHRIKERLVKVRACLTIPSLPEKLSEAGVSWKFYSTPEFPIGDVMRAFKRVRYSDMWNNVVHSESFLRDIRTGNLAAVSWVNPPAPYNEHPILPDRVQSVCAGENWTVAVMNALQRSPAWERTAVIVIWDDFGGFYDHVPPPQYDIMGLGPRTPGLIMSPWTIKGSNPDGGAVDHHTYEFSSVLAFVEERWDIEPMTERDANADPLTGAFDFSSPPDMSPLILPLRKDCPYGTQPPFTDQDNLVDGEPATEPES